MSEKQEQRPTPKTDQEAYSSIVLTLDGFSAKGPAVVPAEFARMLERKLAEKIDEIAKIQHFATVNGTAEMARQLAERTDERDRMLIALEEIRVKANEFASVSWGWDGDCGSNAIIEAIHEISDTAISAAKGATP